MKKKLLILATTLLLLAFAVPAVYAATKPDVTKDINSLYQQITDLQKKIVDKRAEGGQLTSDQAKTVKERLDVMEKYREENGTNVGGMMGGYGGGMMGGNTGYGGCGGYYGNNNSQQNNSQPKNNATGTATNFNSNL